MKPKYTKYISTENFEVIENPTFFEVDEEIAEAVCILNKKGYKTQYSCAGHNDYECYKVKCTMSLLEETKKDEMNHIGKIDDEYFYYYRDMEITAVYVKFIKHYDFKSLPEGFIYQTADELREEIEKYEMDDKSKVVYGDTISCEIKYFENNERRNDEVIEEEIKKANEILLNWAKSLPMVEE